MEKVEKPFDLKGPAWAHYVYNQCKQMGICTNCRWRKARPGKTECEVCAERSAEAGRQRGLLLRKRREALVDYRKGAITKEEYEQILGRKLEDDV